MVAFLTPEDTALGGIDFDVVPVGATMVKQFLIGNDAEVGMDVTLLSSSSRFVFWATGTWLVCWFVLGVHGCDVRVRAQTMCSASLGNSKRWPSCILAPWQSRMQGTKTRVQRSSR